MSGSETSSSGDLSQHEYLPVLITHCSCPGFDTEAQCYDAGVRKKHRASLASSLHYRVRTLQDAALTALLEQQLASFEAEVNVAVAAGRELYTLSRSRCVPAFLRELSRDHFSLLRQGIMHTNL